MENNKVATDVGFPVNKFRELNGTAVMAMSESSTVILRPFEPWR